MGKSAINPAVVGKHSTDIAALKNDLGIVEDGDTATHTIAQGQYVIWQGALYTADAAIASGTTLAASGGNKNLTAVPNGGLNALKSSVDTLNSNFSGLQLVKVDKTVTIPDGTQTDQIVTVDMSDVVPSDKVIHSISDARLSQYPLPYISGSKFTWVSGINDRSIAIKNTATAWNQFLLHVTLFIA